MSVFGEKLIDELISDPKEFNEKLKGYDLLQEYFKGLSIGTLVPLLKSSYVGVYRTAISITSELGEKTCSELLKHIIEVLDKEQDLTYRSYALSCIFLGTYSKNREYFTIIIDELNSQHDNMIIHVMNLISKANRDQLSAAVKTIESKNNLEGLRAILNYEDLNSNEIEGMIHNKTARLQFYGAIMARKVYHRDSSPAKIGIKSSNKVVQTFSKNTIKLFSVI